MNLQVTLTPTVSLKWHGSIAGVKRTRGRFPSFTITTYTQQVSYVKYAVCLSHEALTWSITGPSTTGSLYQHAVFVTELVRIWKIMLVMRQGAEHVPVHCFRADSVRGNLQGKWNWCVTKIANIQMIHSGILNVVLQFSTLCKISIFSPDDCLFSTCCPIPFIVLGDK